MGWRCQWRIQLSNGEGSHLDFTSVLISFSQGVVLVHRCTARQLVQAFLLLTRPKALDPPDAHFQANLTGYPSILSGLHDAVVHNVIYDRAVIAHCR